ncbi:efflux RND transporter permease subunit [Pseudomonas sp. C1C7]|uniref:efflux RND transporter permease subunit n=1 Tax=Pseudomonas sp. C1C7 TaxID=2735272 RepID=UPI0015860A4B|nr:efflux RND transporter permease subunit [Pseudomonas sp. C1C7]NUT76821.1 efflux RND transporter permease subunit [Pseudomonas sp. C1C7]
MTHAAKEALHLLYMILAISPFACIVVCFACVSGISMDKRATFYNFSYHLDPRRGLASQWPLRFWLITILVYFLIAGYICWAPYTLSFTPEGFDTFIEISKFPLALLSLTLPVGVFISRLHSTQQTAAQIEATDMKNRLDAFHAQRKGIVDYIASLGTIELAHNVSLKIQINQAFHSVVFCNSTHETGALEADERVLRQVMRQVRSILDELSLLMPNFKPLKGRVSTDPESNESGIYLELVKLINDLCSKLSVSDYVIDQQSKKTPFTAILPGGEREQHLRLAGSYYELIAILNYCITISYYAMVSENRSESSLQSRLWMESLKKELHTLGRDTSLTFDPIKSYSTREHIYPAPLPKVVSEPA